jgi:hypothetical protein
MKNEKSNSSSSGKELFERKTELVPLNDKLYSEFSIEELEQRLETKAWGCDTDCGTYIECPSNGCNVLADIA